MSEQSEQRLLPFKFSQGKVLCPYCLQPARMQGKLIKVGASVEATYTCSCDAWQRAYRARQEPKS